jgi:hypothetical protein
MAEGLDHGSRWYKSRKCADSACVEVAGAGDDVLIRSSLQPEKIVRVTKAEWTAFVEGVQDGDFPF